MVIAAAVVGVVQIKIKTQLCRRLATEVKLAVGAYDVVVGTVPAMGPPLSINDEVQIVVRATRYTETPPRFFAIRVARPVDRDVETSLTTAACCRANKDKD